MANHTAIPAAVRFQLIEDAFRLVWAEIIPVRIALQLIRYLRWVQDDPFREITLNYVIELKNVVENPAEILELEVRQTISYNYKCIFKFSNIVLIG